MSHRNYRFQPPVSRARVFFVPGIPALKVLGYFRLSASRTQLMGSKNFFMNTSQPNVDPPKPRAACDDFWLKASEPSLDAIWDNCEDDVYAELCNQQMEP